MNEKTKHSYATLNHLTYGAMRDASQDSAKLMFDSIENNNPLFSESECMHRLLELINDIVQTIDAKQDIDVHITAANFVMQQLSILNAVLWHRATIEHTKTGGLEEIVGDAGTAILTLMRHTQGHKERSKHLSELMDISIGKTYQMMVANMKKASYGEIEQLTGSTPKTSD